MSSIGPQAKQVDWENIRELDKWDLIAILVVDSALLGIIIFTIYIMLAGANDLRTAAIIFLCVETVLFLCLTIYLLVNYLGLTRRKRAWKKQIREIQEKKEEANYLDKDRLMQFQDIQERSNEQTIRRAIDIVEQEIQRKKLLKYLYNGKIMTEICQICKLELRKNQKICQCPGCESLFHKEHLEEWLETESECPVCKFKFI